MAFELPQLPWAKDALAPVMSAETIFATTGNLSLAAALPASAADLATAWPTTGMPALASRAIASTSLTAVSGMRGVDFGIAGTLRSRFQAWVKP